MGWNNSWGQTLAAWRGRRHFAKYGKLTSDLRLRNGIRLPICARQTLFFIVPILPLIVRCRATVDDIPTRGELALKAGSVDVTTQWYLLWDETE